MYTIIQEKLKRINSRLSPMISASIFGSLLIVISFLIGRESASLIPSFSKGEGAKQEKNIYINYGKKENAANIDNQNSVIKSQSIENQNVVQVNVDQINVGRIYASSKGKKYYIEGLCDGNISIKNKVYYKDESAALKSGKAKAAGCK